MKISFTKNPYKSQKPQLNYKLQHKIYQNKSVDMVEGMMCLGEHPIISRGYI
ncbi:hypothetical protein Syun_009861 [Stephania yunnanensis]|uniref:Uncharacterized protein n=1 Tax=Stephania yunnanensis TaxID=152371 RepID=A0AAP0PPF7_9MAGN